MSPLETIRMALSSLWANKLRSILTMLGITISTMSVITVVSIIHGLQIRITEELQGMGATYMVAYPVRDEGYRYREPQLTWEDGEAVAALIPELEQVSPITVRQMKLRHHGKEHSVLVSGVRETYPEVRNHMVDRGRFILRADLERRRMVVVVGPAVVEELGLGPEPIGTEIYVGRSAATVVGVMEERGQVLGQDGDDVAFIPFDTALGLFGPEAGTKIQLEMRARDREVVARAKDSVMRVLRTRHAIPDDEPNDFRVKVQDDLLSTADNILGGITAVIGAIAGIGLLVGGIGIMNVMLVSITERTREIGVRKAIGARRRDVMYQFLTESVVLAVLGGIAGVALGYLVGAAIGLLLPEGWPTATVPGWIVVFAVGFCTSIGVFFGIYPAVQASKLRAIEALRQE